jgi:hypothetical protein
MQFSAIVQEAFERVVQNRMHLLNLLIVPFLIIFGWGILQDKTTSTFLSFLSIGVGLIVQTVIAITIHRVILLGSEQVTSENIYQWSKRETRFALHLVALILFMGSIGIVALVFNIFGLIIGPFLSLWVFSRCSLVFPAIALNKEFSFEHSWKLTSEHQLQMFLVVLAFPFLLNMPLFFLKQINGLWMIASILSTLSVVFTIAALSVSYECIVEKPKMDGG